jgi:hypothetical protein
MAQLYGQSWTKKELLTYCGDVRQAGGLTPFSYSDGRAKGVDGVRFDTGTGFAFTVLPGRGMDIPEATYCGVPLAMKSANGVTAPEFFEPEGLGWLRSFFVGLLTTCGLRNAGPPHEDQGESLGLHGRISNIPAENISVDQKWDGDEYVMEVKGSLKETKFFGENLLLTRTVTSRLGWKKFIINDVIENRGFETEPLMLLYHLNVGYPLLSPQSRIVAPIAKTEPRDEDAKKDNGIENCLRFEPPYDQYNEKVFFHTLHNEKDGKTFVSILNDDIGNGHPMGLVIRFNRNQLPDLVEWKMMKRGTYVLGLEPGNVVPIGRAACREKDVLPQIEGQESVSVDLEVEVLDSKADFEAIEKEASQLK